MITVIIQNNYLLFSFVSLVAFFFFMLGLYGIFKLNPTKQKALPQQKNLPVAGTATESYESNIIELQSLARLTLPTLTEPQDLSAIAGEDLISTQLDLARAYLEVGKKALAQNILKRVIMEGNKKEQEEAKQLLKK